MSKDKLTKFFKMNTFIEYIIIGTFINLFIMIFFRLVYLFSRNKGHDMIARKHKYNIINTISIL